MGADRLESGNRTGDRLLAVFLRLEIIPVAMKLRPLLTHAARREAEPLGHLQRPFADRQGLGNPPIPRPHPSKPLVDVDPRGRRGRRSGTAVFQQNLFPLAGLAIAPVQSPQRDMLLEPAVVRGGTSLTFNLQPSRRPARYCRTAKRVSAEGQATWALPCATKRASAAHAAHTTSATASSLAAGRSLRKAY